MVKVLQRISNTLYVTLTELDGSVSEWGVLKNLSVLYILKGKVTDVSR